MASQNNKMTMPSSQGGLVRYFDEYKSKYQFKPSYVLILAAVVIIIEVLLHTFGTSGTGASTAAVTSPVSGG